MNSCVIFPPATRSGWARWCAPVGGSRRFGARAGSIAPARRQVKFFTNFSCEGGGQLLKHGLDFVVSQTTFDW
jgi:hypothetical protein